MPTQHEMCASATQQATINMLQDFLDKRDREHSEIIKRWRKADPKDKDAIEAHADAFDLETSKQRDILADLRSRKT